MINQNKNLFTIRNLTITIFVALVIFSFSGSALASSITSENLLTIINQKRAEKNLSPLKNNPDLNAAATLKSKDMINRDYFEHYWYGLTPWDFIKNSGYEYLYAGENLAMDFQSSEGMINAWMNSSSHRENILNPEYTDIGFGIVKGEYTENNNTRETTIVTNMFGRKKPLIIKYFNMISNSFLNIF